jgi:2-C-methyl-D-erythritol 2,4-cyclodiphosphate synthase
VRVGQGYDIHRLAGGRPLVLGGVVIPHSQGPSGHSDADPLIHALIDALLGAAGLGDIGAHFPPDDPRWRDAPGAQLLERTLTLVAGAGFRPHNVDATVIVERPVLAPHIVGIRGSLAGLLGLDVGRVNVKAKTNEGFDALGQRRAVAAQVVVLLEEPAE